MAGDACGCHIGPWWGVEPPPRCVTHGGPPPALTMTGTSVPFPYPFPTHEEPPAHVIDYGQYQPTLRGSPTIAIVATLTDQDVERIARRVVELLREAPKP